MENLVKSTVKSTVKNTVKSMVRKVLKNCQCWVAGTSGPEYSQEYSRKFYAWDTEE